MLLHITSVSTQPKAFLLNRWRKEWRRRSTDWFCLKGLLLFFFFFGFFNLLLDFFSSVEGGLSAVARSLCRCCCVFSLSVKSFSCLSNSPVHNFFPALLADLFNNFLRIVLRTFLDLAGSLMLRVSFLYTPPLSHGGLSDREKYLYKLKYVVRNA